MSSRLNGIKVGDRVRIKKCPEFSDRYILSTGFFERHQGKKGVMNFIPTSLTFSIVLDDGCTVGCPKELVEKSRFQLPEELFEIE